MKQAIFNIIVKLMAFSFFLSIHSNAAMAKTDEGPNAENDSFHVMNSTLIGGFRLCIAPYPDHNTETGCNASPFLGLRIVPDTESGRSFLCRFAAPSVPGQQFPGSADMIRDDV